MLGMPGSQAGRRPKPDPVTLSTQSVGNAFDASPRRPSEHAEGSRLISAFGQRHRQDQHGEWQADRDGESERDHCSVQCRVVIAEPRG